jgi:hypothetical protein
MARVCITRQLTDESESRKRARVRLSDLHMNVCRSSHSPCFSPGSKHKINSLLSDDQNDLSSTIFFLSGNFN